MTHLSDVELVDLVDGTLPEQRLRHVEACELCRDQVAHLRSALARVADVEVAEPSPLFWEHFSARVHDAVHEAKPDAPRWWSWADGTTVRWTVGSAAATAVLVAAVWVGVWGTSIPGGQHRRAMPASTSVATAVDSDAFDPDTDEAWALVRAVADESSWDDQDADGLGVKPGSAERAMETLSGDERTELVRLLEAEMKQKGA
jgi:hypothetical protein